MAGVGGGGGEQCEVLYSNPVIYVRLVPMNPRVKQELEPFTNTLAKFREPIFDFSGPFATIWRWWWCKKAGATRPHNWIERGAGSSSFVQCTRLRVGFCLLDRWESARARTATTGSHLLTVSIFVCLSLSHNL